MSKDVNAVINADVLLTQILDKQSNLFSALPPRAENGQAVGQFIAALRAELIQMYEKQPRA